MREKSPRSDFAGRLLWGGVARTLHAVAGFTSLLATCAAFALGGVNAVSAQELVYSESFDFCGQADPPGWFDSAPGNPVEEAPGQFKIWPDPAGGGYRVFGKRGAADSFTHLRSHQFSTSSRFEMTARVWRGRDSGSFGWTFFSTFPSPPAYFLIRQLASGGGLRLESSEFPPPVGDLEGEVRARPRAWYRLRLLSEPQGAGLRLRVRLWDAALVEPDSWQIDAVTASRPAEGWIGLWSAGAGGNYWDDLAVYAAASAPLVLRVLEGGVELVDGALFNRDVVPVLDTTGGTAPITLDATLDGAPFTSGSIVTGDGLHLLQASAEDADGLTAEIAVQFSIDTLAPIFVSVSPPEGFVTSSPAVVLSGEVSGATTLTVNGAPVVIANDLFTSEPLPLAEGAQSFLLVAIRPGREPDPAGAQYRARLALAGGDDLPAGARGRRELAHHRRGYRHGSASRPGSRQRPGGGGRWRLLQPDGTRARRRGERDRRRGLRRRRQSARNRERRGDPRQPGTGDRLPRERTAPRRRRAVQSHGDADRRRYRRDAGELERDPQRGAVRVGDAGRRRGRLHASGDGGRRGRKLRQPRGELRPRQDGADASSPSFPPTTLWWQLPRSR